MVAIPGATQRFVVVGAPAYLLQAGRPSDPHELSRHRCIRIRFPSGARYRWEFEKAGEKLEVDVSGPLDVGEMPLMLRAAEDSLGLAYVYEETAQASLAAGRLETVLDDWRPTEAGFFLYYPSRRLPSAGLQKFIELVKESRVERTGTTPKRQAEASASSTDTSAPTILTRLLLDVSPLSSETADFGTPHTLARKASSAALALPSTGGAASLIFKASP
jgi:hypothetical protein